MLRGTEFQLVLRLGFLFGLPLHIARRVGPTSCQRNDVVHHVTWAAVGIASLLQELALCRFAPLDLAMAITRDSDRRASPTMVSSGEASRRVRVARVGASGGQRRRDQPERQQERLETTYPGLHEAAILQE